MEGGKGKERKEKEGETTGRQNIQFKKCSLYLPILGLPIQ